MRFHIFNRQGAAKGIPEAVFQRGLDWTFFAKINPEKNPFGSNLMRNGCTEEVSSDVSTTASAKYFLTLRALPG